jgi:hypothetical protein
MRRAAVSMLYSIPNWLDGAQRRADVSMLYYVRYPTVTIGPTGTVSVRMLGCLCVPNCRNGADEQGCCKFTFDVQ